MPVLTNEQKAAVLAVVSAVLDVARAAGPEGVPGGTLYAALMTHGCSLEQFEALMGALVKAGRLTQRGQLYFAALPPDGGGIVMSKDDAGCGKTVTSSDDAGCGKTVKAKAGRPLGSPRRPFTPDECSVITRRFLAYDNVADIAASIGRSENTLRQKILHLGLRRDVRVTHMLRNELPDHVRQVLIDRGAEEFLHAARAHADELRAQDQHARVSVEEKMNHDASAILADKETSRRDKMIAMREAGFSLTAIGSYFDLTRERVRQITDKVYIKNQRTRRHQQRLTNLRQDVDDLERGENALARRRDALLADLETTFAAMPEEVQRRFLDNKIIRSGNQESTKTEEGESP